MVEPEQVGTLSVPSDSASFAATEDGAGPMMASTLSVLTSLLYEVWATVGLVPSSPSMTVTGLPSTPPASLISSTAMSTGVCSDSTMFDRSPDCGTRVPKITSPSALPRSEAFSASVVVVDSSLDSSSPPHALATSASAPTTSTTRASWTLRMMYPRDPFGSDATSS